MYGKCSIHSAHIWDLDMDQLGFRHGPIPSIKACMIDPRRILDFLLKNLLVKMNLMLVINIQKLPAILIPFICNLFSLQNCPSFCFSGSYRPFGFSFGFSLLCTSVGVQTSIGERSEVFGGFFLVFLCYWKSVSQHNMEPTFLSCLVVHNLYDSYFE